MFTIPLSWLKDFVDINVPAEQLAEDLTVSGTNVESLTKTNDDYILELEITSNRPDCLSVIGIAREISAIYKLPLKLPEIPTLEALKKSGKNLSFQFVQENSSLSPVFTAAVFDEVIIKESSDLIKYRLECCGMRPLNNVIDISNYLMLETGQPSHAFDFDKIKGGYLHIRESKNGEKIITLDEKLRNLSEGAIVIEDQEKIIDLAGIMGGKNSETSNNSKTILLLVPIYDPVRVRRTAKYLALRTEAVNRFEKKIDLTQTKNTLLRIAKMFDAELASEIYHYDSVNYQAGLIVFNKDRVEKLIGVKIDDKEIASTLKFLGFNETTPPSWRRDVNIIEDIIEEIARIHGYNKFERTLPSGGIPQQTDLIFQDYEREVKNILIGCGFTEIINQTMGSVKTDLAVLHPMSEDYTYMRRSLIPGLINNVEYNLHNVETVDIFELGKVFLPVKEDLPYQPKYLGVMSTTKNYREMKGVVEIIFDRLNIDINKIPSDLWQIGIARDGWTYLEINFSKILADINPQKIYLSLPKYPAIVEDLCLIGEGEVKIGEVVTSITQVDSLIKNVELLDVYEKNLTFRITYQHADKNLSAEDVRPIREKILKDLQQKYSLLLKKV